jgi:hypothetical protein
MLKHIKKANDRSGSLLNIIQNKAINAWAKTCKEIKKRPRKTHNKYAKNCT